MARKIKRFWDKTSSNNWLVTIMNYQSVYEISGGGTLRCTFDGIFCCCGRWLPTKPIKFKRKRNKPNPKQLMYEIIQSTHRNQDQLLWKLLLRCLAKGNDKNIIFCKQATLSECCKCTIECTTQCTSSIDFMNGLIIHNRN